MNEGASALRVPLTIFAKLLQAVAARASELHDSELDAFDDAPDDVRGCGSNQ